MNGVIRKASLRKCPLSHSQGKRREGPWWMSAILPSRQREEPSRQREEPVQGSTYEEARRERAREESGRGVGSGWWSWGLIKPWHCGDLTHCESALEGLGDRMTWSSSNLSKKSLTVLWKADHPIVHIVGLISGVCAE